MQNKQASALHPLPRTRFIGCFINCRVSVVHVFYELTITDSLINQFNTARDYAALTPKLIVAIIPSFGKHIAQTQHRVLQTALKMARDAPRIYCISRNTPVHGGPKFYRFFTKLQRQRSTTAGCFTNEENETTPRLFSRPVSPFTNS